MSQSGTGSNPGNGEGGDVGHEVHDAPAPFPDFNPSPEPGADPFRLGVPWPQVKRLSRNSLTILGGVSAALVAGSVIYALRTSPPAAPRNLVEPMNATKAFGLAGGTSDYSQVPRLGPPLPGDLGRPILEAEQAQARNPAPPDQDTKTQQARERRAASIEAARSSGLFAAHANEDDSGSSPGGTSMTQLPLSLASQMSASASQPAATTSADTAGVAGNRAFLRQGEQASPVSDARIVTPPSANVVQAGSIIPAALITGIQSDLPGQITAQVTQNVYDSPTGTILLIPQGARLIGTYDSAIAAGQTRVLFAWDRLIFPGGRSIMLDRLAGADASGMAGLADRTNHHWGNVLKAALVSSVLSVGSDLAADSDGRLVRALREGTQDTVSQTGRQLVQREIDVPPTLSVRPGYPLRVIVTRDLVLAPVSKR
ncbi:TrbI/VirB10 family protein [Novosphingobium sp. 9]|uniref:TrbI/VirB10 family protein n=1 Tax=Novosphingobium sp. 9 TaxID=2025349 RepID=UPI0021B4E1B9|nr:TrbI/VirB10 family protein [Novosphingobium sp. 9]